MTAENWLESSKDHLNSLQKHSDYKTHCNRFKESQNYLHHHHLHVVHDFHLVQNRLGLLLHLQDHHYRHDQQVLGVLVDLGNQHFQDFRQVLDYQHHLDYLHRHSVDLVGQNHLNNILWIISTIFSSYMLISH